jgi:hypothetical protein
MTTMDNRVGGGTRRGGCNVLYDLDCRVVSQIFELCNDVHAQRSIVKPHHLRSDSALPRPDSESSGSSGLSGSWGKAAKSSGVLNRAGPVDSSVVFLCPFVQGL